LAYPEPTLLYLVEWWKQLYGESEGKSSKGIFPAGIQFTADLHSLGQYVQDGHRHLFETFLYTEGDTDPLLIPKRSDNDDELQYLQHTAVDSLNRAAMQATMIAHHDGGVPGIGIQLGGWSAQHLGSLIAFFEVACALSADLFVVNAFDQPGVEAYKKNLFALLAKPGFEAGRPAMMKQLQRHGL
jgi:glucose-6-phosphate isomerase